MLAKKFFIGPQWLRDNNNHCNFGGEKMFRGKKTALLVAGSIWLGLLLSWGGPSAAPAVAAQGQDKVSAQQPGEQQPSYQVITDLIAGNPVDAAVLAGLVNPPGFQDYIQGIEEVWRGFANRHLQPIRQWAAQEIGDSSTATVFYPFSGPDLVNLLAFFPKAKTYVLLALEPVGTLPVFRPGANEPFYQSLEYALNELLQFNFFFTNQMAHDLRRQELNGVLPLLLFFLGREQAQVKEVTYLLHSPEQQLQEKPALPGEKVSGPGIPGVRIIFQRGASEPEQAIYYFSINLQNASWRQSPQFVEYLKGLGPFQTLVKAASYLMFKPHYGDIRQFILSNSLMVLQTDEGIPVRYFAAEQWERRFFGVYKRPIALFQNCYQPDLAALYQQQPVAPLPFGIGYHHRRNSANLMLARRLPRLVEEGGN